MDKTRLCNRRLQRAARPERGFSTASPRSKAPIAPTERAAAIRRRASRCTIKSRQRQPRAPAHHEPQRHTCRASHCAAEPQQRQPRPPVHHEPRRSIYHTNRCAVESQQRQPRSPAHFEPRRSIYHANHCAAESQQRQPCTPAHHEPRKRLPRKPLRRRTTTTPAAQSHAPQFITNRESTCRTSHCAAKL